MKINGDGKDYLNRIGKVSYIRHYVVPEKWRQRVLYLLHKFIYLEPWRHSKLESP